MNRRTVSSALQNKSADSVLLVDDEEALLEIYAAILEPHFAVATARNSAEADALLAGQSFKVIVADHRMPGETGLDLLARVRVKFPHMQRVLVTGNMTPEMLASVRESRLLHGFLTKPVTVAQLVDAVRAAARTHDATFATTP